MRSLRSNNNERVEQAVGERYTAFVVWKGISMMEHTRKKRPLPSQRASPRARSRSRGAPRPASSVAQAPPAGRVYPLKNTPLLRKSKRSAGGQAACWNTASGPSSRAGATPVRRRSWRMARATAGCLPICSQKSCHAGRSPVLIRGLPPPPPMG